MNDDLDNKKSSSQMNTTPFKNKGVIPKRLNNIRNSVGNSNTQPLPNRSTTNINEKDNEIPVRNSLNNIESDSQSLNVNNNRNNNQQGTRSNNLNSSSGGNNRFGQGNVANNLRNQLNTIPTNLDNAKKEALKKGSDVLKKSADPIAKAAGYAMGAYQKKQEKKEQEENGEEENKDNDDNPQNDNNNEETTKTVEEKRGQKLLKKLMPILISILPILLIFLVIFATLMPIITAFSNFISLFYHKTENASVYTVTGGQDDAKVKAEQDYNNALRGSSDGSVKGIVKEYQEKYGVTIDWYLLNALIMYRYNISEGDMYSSDGDNDISDDEINQRLDDLENMDTTETSDESTTDDDTNSVDYGAATKKIKAFASLMVVKDGGTYKTDKEKNGVVYNNVLSSNTFKDYYKSVLKDTGDESKKKLLDEIYDYADYAREMFPTEEEELPGNSGVVSETAIIHLQNCQTPYSLKTINGIKVFNNPSASTSSTYPDYLNIRDYLKGLLKREYGISSDIKEGMKAQVIAALSFIFSDSRTGFNLKSGEMYYPSGTCRQATCNPTYGCTQVQESNGLHSFYMGQNVLSTSGKSGKSFPPLTATESAIADEVIDEVFGKIMVKKGVTASNYSGSSDTITAHFCATWKCSSCTTGKCLNQTLSHTDARSGTGYEAILKKYYSSVDYDIINISESLYYQSGGTELGTGQKVLNEEYHYHQGESPWGSMTLCGTSGTISSLGCNITAAAIAISLTTQQKITPQTLQNRHNDISTCAYGSRPQMIRDFAKLYGLNVTVIKKDDTSEINSMLQKIATGNYVAVARLKENSGIYNTTNGHYITLVSAKTEGNVNKVLVWDPGYKSNKNRDNAWHDINYITKYLNSSYSFILIGK